MHSTFNLTQSTLLRGEGDSRNNPLHDNNIVKRLQEVKYELIWQSASLCLISPSVPRRFDRGYRFVYTDMFTLQIQTYVTYVIIHCTHCLSPRWLKAYS